MFVDHGLLRLNEGDMVMEMFAGKLHAKVIRVDASELFLGELAGVTDPEQKRKIIGRLFVDVFKAEAAKLKAGDAGHKGATFLAQGTIYPDVVESGGRAVTLSPWLIQTLSMPRPSGERKSSMPSSSLVWPRARTSA